MHYWALLLLPRHECGNNERLEEQQLGKDNTTLSKVFVTPPLLLTWPIGRPIGHMRWMNMNLERISMADQENLLRFKRRRSGNGKSADIFLSRDENGRQSCCNGRNYMLFARDAPQSLRGNRRKMVDVVLSFPFSRDAQDGSEGKGISL